MRIAFSMINCNRQDGSARAVCEVAERLADRGHQIHLYARKAEQIDFEKIQLHCVPGPGWPEVADFVSYHLLANRMIRPGKFDIVHSIGCNTLRANVVTIQNIQPAKMKVLNRISADEAISPFRRMTRRFYLKVTSAGEKRLYEARPRRRPLLFLPVSRGVERELRAHYDIGSADVRIIPNAADIEHFKPIPSEERLTWRVRNGFKAEDIILAFAGGEWIRKGLDLAVRALALIPGDHIKLFIAGDDSCRAGVVQLVRDLGIQERVVFGGFRRDIATSMAAADVFLFPSWYEAFSLATIEAASCGLALVTTRINGAEDFVDPGVNGQFIEHDPEHIAAVLRELLGSRERVAMMGANARECVEKGYTWDLVTEKTETAYRNHLEGSARIAAARLRN